MNQPLVSVIIPNYCHSCYLDQRLESILSQTYKNFEIIILDDCSPDGGASRSVIEKYRNIPAVTHIVYNEHNSGSSFKQWHKGFELAKGELIWIAESDDYCDNDLLETLVPEFEKDDECVLAFVGSQYVDADGKPKSENGCLLPNDGIIERSNGIKFIQNHLRLGNHVQNASSAVFKKSVALSVDNQYTNYKGAGDQLFWIELSERGNVVFNHRLINKFRQHGNNTTQKLYANGRTFRELHDIYLYQCRHHLFSSIKRQYSTRFFFIHWIDHVIEDADLLNELHSLWDPHKTNRVVSMVYNRFRRFC